MYKVVALPGEFVRTLTGGLTKVGPDCGSADRERRSYVVGTPQCEVVYAACRVHYAAETIDAERTPA